MTHVQQACLLEIFGVLPGIVQAALPSVPFWDCALHDSGCCRWVEGYHVDGFRFDLASALCRDPLGQPMTAPPLIREMANDPVLSKVPLCSPA